MAKRNSKQAQRDLQKFRLDRERMDREKTEKKKLRKAIKSKESGGGVKLRTKGRIIISKKLKTNKGLKGTQGRMIIRSETKQKAIRMDSSL